MYATILYVSQHYRDSYGYVAQSLFTPHKYTYFIIDKLKIKQTNAQEIRIIKQKTIFFSESSSFKE